ncbi:hypothetical protein HK100_004003 [Physocladia obscura]|uniref:Uncharacterized protein n=1 Tax=Physocladia obscura TaxID=109957 RepID=A0AAD5SUY3_9FUNG|nr:hypothetical protein HK100_004003 [Physocladia obscura]
MKAVRPMSEGFLDLVNAAFCAQTLIKFQALVVKCAPSGATTTIPQIFIGTLSITGGGILYDWCFNSSIRFAFPGYEFAVAALVNAFYAYQSNPANRKFFFSLVWNSLPMKTIREFGFSENIFRFWKFFVETFVQAAKLAGVPVVFRGKTGDADLKALCALLLIVGFWLRPGKWITTWDAYTNFSAGGGGVTKNDRKTENETVGEGETVAALQETVDNSEKTKANIKKRHKHKPDETH